MRLAAGSRLRFGQFALVERVQPVVRVAKLDRERVLIDPQPLHNGTVVRDHVISANSASSSAARRSRARLRPGLLPPVPFTPWQRAAIGCPRRCGPSAHSQPTL